MGRNAGFETILWFAPGEGTRDGRGPLTGT